MERYRRGRDTDEGDKKGEIQIWLKVNLLVEAVGHLVEALQEIMLIIIFSIVQTTQKSQGIRHNCASYVKTYRI